MHTLFKALDLLDKASLQAQRNLTIPFRQKNFESLTKKALMRLFNHPPDNLTLNPFCSNNCLSKSRFSP